MHAPARQPPQGKAVDGAEGQLTALGACARARHMVEQPGDLGAGEVRVEQQPRLAANQGLGARGLEGRTRLRRAPVLPHDGAMDRLAAGALPDDRRLALVGDAERRDAGDAAGGALDDLASRRERVAPAVLRIVLDPSGSGIVLLELATRDGDRTCLCVKYDGPRRGGPLIDRQHVGGVAHGTKPKARGPGGTSPRLMLPGYNIDRASGCRGPYSRFQLTPGRAAAAATAVRCLYSHGIIQFLDFQRCRKCEKL